MCHPNELNIFLQLLAYMYLTVLPTNRRRTPSPLRAFVLKFAKIGNSGKKQYTFCLKNR